MYASSSAGATPAFDASAARFTWTSAGTSRRRAAESESSEWTSSQTRLTTFTLFDCSWPMKCHRNVSPYSACFASRSCARFSPTTVTPASASTAMSSSRTYLVAATTVTFGPTSACTRASRSRISSGDRTEHSLDAAVAAAPPVREEEVLVAPRADVDAVDARDARSTERTFGSGPQVETPADGQVAVEEAGDLATHLVAARADRRADDRCGLAVAERRDPRVDDAL